jgi:hypothetical protein
LYLIILEKYYKVPLSLMTTAIIRTSTTRNEVYTHNSPDWARNPATMQQIYAHFAEFRLSQRPVNSVTA